MLLGRSFPVEVKLLLLLVICIKCFQVITENLKCLVLLCPMSQIPTYDLSPMQERNMLTEKLHFLMTRVKLMHSCRITSIQCRMLEQDKFQQNINQNALFIF